MQSTRCAAFPRAAFVMPGGSAHHDERNPTIPCHAAGSQQRTLVQWNNPLARVHCRFAQ